jgi:hypothetical protein
MLILVPSRGKFFTNIYTVQREWEGRTFSDDMFGFYPENTQFTQMSVTDSNTLDTMMAAA